MVWMKSAPEPDVTPPRVFRLFRGSAIERRASQHENAKRNRQINENKRQRLEW
jgi:hypothetical protein